MKPSSTLPLLPAAAAAARRQLRRLAVALRLWPPIPGSTRAKRRNNARLLAAHRAGRVELDALPNFLILDTSSKCNLKCRMCWQTIVPEEVIPRVHLQRSVLERAVEVKETLTRINFHGSGEPLLNVHFGDIIGRFRGDVDYMETCTNGTAVTAKNARQLLEAGLNVIRFSCDGDNAESFERLRCGARFDKFLDNVRLTESTRRALGAKSHLGFNFVVTAESWRELPGVIRLAEELGLDFVAVFAYIEMEGTAESLAVPEDGLAFVRGFIRDYRADPQSKCYLMLAPTLDVGHAAMDQVPDAVTTTKGDIGHGDNRARCGALYSMMNVKADGAVYPCCIHPRKMGDLNTQSVAEVWNGPEYREMRRQHASGEVDEMCRRCFDGLRYVVAR